MRRSAASREPSILQISGAPVVSERYRADRIRRLLYSVGVRPRQLDLAQLESWADPRARCEEIAGGLDLLLMHRLPYSEAVGLLVAAARRAGALVAWEADDLVFQPGIERWVDGVRRLDGLSRHLYRDGCERYQRCFLEADVFVTSTPYLAGLAGFLGKRTLVLPNTPCPDFVVAADELWSRFEGRAMENRENVVIGYGAGTATHDRDLAVAADALASTLERFPFVELHLIGDVQPPEQLRSFESKVRVLPAVAWEDWPARLAAIDISIAPLETANPFCRAKSGLKFLEAAYLGVPTVASDIDGFRDVMDDNVTGFLAADTAGWERALASLVTSPQLRRSMGERAREVVRERHAPPVAAAHVLSALRGLLERPPREGEQLDNQSAPALFSVSWLLPTPFAGSGGLNDVFQTCRALEASGVRNTLHVDTAANPALRDDGELERLLLDAYGLDRCEIRQGWNGDCSADLAVATLWSSALHLAAGGWPGTRCYFVQDFEPYFFCPGEPGYWASETTYRLGFNTLALGPWLAKELEARYSCPVSHWDFPVDRRFYHPEPSLSAASRRVVFFAQPGKARRAYELGVKALEALAAGVPDVDIVMFGSDAVDTTCLPFRATSLGVLNDGELAQLYRGATVGLSLSHSNPSLVPFAMLACGCPVVEVDLPPNLATYGSDSGVVLAPPSPQPLANAIARVLTDPGLRSALSAAALRYGGELSFERSISQVKRALLRAFLTGSVVDSPPLLFCNPAGERAVELAPTTVVIQELCCRPATIREIALRCEPPAPDSACACLRVYDERRVEIASATSAAPRDEYDPWLRFHFSSLSTHPTSSVHLALTARDGAGARKLAVPFTRRNLQGAHSLSIDGRVGPGSLALNVYGS